MRNNGYTKFKKKGDTHHFFPNLAYSRLVGGNKKDKIMNEVFKKKNISSVLLSTFFGYLVGVIIAYINLFESSQNATWLCAVGASAFAIASLKRRN